MPKKNRATEQKAVSTSSVRIPDIENYIEFGIRPVEFSSSVKATADILREEIFRVRAEGVFFGHEPDLIARLGISRSTFRQAVRILEHEQLLETRRGVDGGLYTRHPTGEAVADFASIYLVSAKAELRDVMLAMSPLREEAVRLLASSGDAALRNSPLQYLDRHEGFDAVHDYRIIHRVINGYNKLIAELCGNPVLALFLEVMRRFANETRWDAALATDEAQLSPYIETLRHQARAIAAGDVPRAIEASRQQAGILISWIS